MTLKKRTLGKSNLVIGPLALGGNVFGWTIDEATSFRVLDAFVDAGFNLIDTADLYSSWAPGNCGGESESIIGKWFQKSKKRDRVVIATKVGMELSPEKKDSASNGFLKPSKNHCSVYGPTPSISTRRIRMT